MENCELQWSDEMCLKLIEYFHGEPILWNTKHSHYKNSKLKNDAWQRIATSMDMPKGKEIMKKKINSLQASFRKIKSRIKTKNGMGADKMITPTWFAFKALSFLNKRAPGKIISTRDEELQDNHENSYSSDDTGYLKDVPSNQSNNTEAMQDLFEANSQDSNRNSTMTKIDKDKIYISTDNDSNGSRDIVFRSPQKIKRNKKKITDDPRIEGAYKMLEAVSRRQKHDEFDAFGEYIAAKLRSFDKISQIYVQKEINDIIFVAHLGKYSDSKSE